MAKSNQHHQVVIAGGGVGGITLALVFEKLNIDYCLLEGRDSLESDRGAGIGLQPNGLRILDQLGLAGDIEKQTLPVARCFSYDSEGNLLSTSSSMGRFSEEVGYPIAFVERPKLMPILVNRIKQVERIHTSARVSSIRETDDEVIITTTSGETITADVLVGSDGVHSVVRSYIDSVFDKNRTADDYLDIRTSTVYGVSSPTEGMAPGDRFAVYREKETVIGFTGLDGVIFWFTFDTLGKIIPVSQTPHYTDEDADALCEAVAHLQVTPKLTFRDIFKNRVVSVRVAVEEGATKDWHTDRVVIVGDAACKTTPAGGQGANQAIESCAELVNRLMEAKRASAPGEKLSKEALKAALEKYTEERKKSAAAILERTQIIGQGLLRFPGKPTVAAEQSVKLPEDEWLFQAYTGFTISPVLADVPLTEKGKLFAHKVKEVQAEVERRQNAAKAA